MQEAIGNIWEEQGAAIIAITTNGQVGRSGRAIMGRGVAAQAAQRDPQLPLLLGERLRTHGNHVHLLRENLVSFPVEHGPFETPDPRLIVRSARELVALADEQGWQRILVPRPGCGGGGLDWREIRPLLASLFDDRFILIAAPELQGRCL